MFKIVISCAVILSTIFYCVWEQNKTYTIMKENCIEIYLYEDYVMPKNCVWYKDTNNYDNSYRAAERSIFDTIINKHLQGKEFNLNNKFDKTLIIKNEEIINFKNQYLLINLKKYHQLFQWESPINLKQFVITVNKKPVLNGYFHKTIMSYIVHDEVLLYDTTGLDTKHKTKSGFYKNYLKPEHCDLYLFNFRNGDMKNINLQKDYPELFNAFKNTNRLIE